MAAKEKLLRKDRTALKKTSRAGRPRSNASHAAILAAALKLLHAKGYRAVTIEGIAFEASVGKQTIYRWWRSKAEVILEAFARHTADRIAVPDSGNMQTDLEKFLVKAFDSLTHEAGEVVRGLMSEALIDPDFAESLRTIFIASRRRALRDILFKGVQRGELGSDVDIEFVIDLVYGAMWYRLLNRHAPLNHRFARQLSELVGDGLRLSR